MKQIIVIGDNSSTNLGDPILTQSAHYVIRNIAEGKGFEVSIFDIAGRKARNTKSPQYPPHQTNVSQKPSALKSSLNDIKHDVATLLKWHLRAKQQFQNRLEKCIHSDEPTFVIAGGALISSSTFYALRLNAIVNMAKRYNGRVVFNAVGIEKTIHNLGFAKYLVRHCLRQPEVTAFSTRDHVEEIPYLTHRKNFLKLLPDSGLFAAEAFGIERKYSDTVGLSVISYQAYQSVMSYDERARGLTPDDLLSFWENILKGFIKREQDFRILTNGGPKDYEMALRLCQRMQLNTAHYLLPMATTPKQLVEQLSQFKVVIAHRLHALIICTSLGIPVIPIIWSNKVHAFAKMIGNPYAQWPSAVNHINETVDAIEKETTDISRLKESIIDYINRSVIPKNDS